MIYSNVALSLLLAGLGQQAEGFHLGKPLLCTSSVSSRYNPLYISPTEDSVDLIYENGQPMITVRFINTVGGKDVVSTVEQGSNLLFIGDQAGVKLPRSCRTGLCASCTCEVQDPQAVATASNPRDGYATIRACSTKCYVPPGMDEMIVDVYRMQLSKKKVVRKTEGGTAVVEVEKEAYVRHFQCYHS
jgi:ferredoxin